MGGAQQAARPTEAAATDPRGVVALVWRVVQDATLFARFKELVTLLLLGTLVLIAAGVVAFSYLHTSGTRWLGAGSLGLVATLLAVVRRVRR